MSFVALLDELERGGAIDIDAAFATIMNGEADPNEIKRFLALTVQHMRDPAWIAAGARALRGRMVRVEAPADAIDVCGTGGDGAHTLNISTAVTFVVAGCGVPAAKHGNRAMSSKSGAADVLEALGVKLTGDVPTLERALREAGVAFLFAQNHHPAMRHVAGPRRELGHRTIFNLLGPLSNPAGVKRQLVGVFNAEFVEPIAAALKQLGGEQAVVVHGAGGIDELTFVDANGDNRAVFLSANGGLRPLNNIDVHALSREFEIPPNSSEALRGGDAAYNANALRALLEGRMQGSAYEATVLLNATAALVAAGAIPAESELEGWRMAHESIANGRALEALDRLIEITRSAP
ncbi:anthranilate phosphoribosyltransferase [Vitreimonas flagellata]|uniref:anthranilate phosphoribosyltransferase n=1 Tax=Vitreimonas flagellata TaxID=2560861 RepID=UPI001075562D|nr:anthranilate phosphoribosyltransferase [Vitreimonas flagellata]